MSANNLSFRDRLEDRGWVDRWGFILFAFGGAAAILLAKGRDVPAYLVACGAAAVIIAYAFIVQRSGTGKLRADQAGDNCYYLGLVYTLVSLGYAIFFFDPATTATTVVQGFGVALATTIVGLVLRVFFNQTRVDLVQTEDSARIELAEAAGRLKAELQSMTVSMSDFGRETRQVLEELREQVVSSLVTAREEATRTVSETTTAASKTVGAAASEAAATVAQQADDALSRSRKVSTATNKVVAGMEKHAEIMDRIEQSSVAMAAGLASLESASERLQENMDGVAARSTQLLSTQTELKQAGSDLHSALAAMTEQVQHLSGVAQRFEANVAAKLDDVGSMPGTLAQRASEALDKTAAAMDQQVEALARSQQSFVQEIAQRAEASVASLERHNSELERELAKSRDNVSKVHSALVDMTGTLVRDVQTAGA